VLQRRRRFDSERCGQRAAIRAREGFGKGCRGRSRHADTPHPPNRRGVDPDELYLTDVADAGLELQLVQANPAYRFTSERARRTSEKYGAQSISLLALKTNPKTQEVPQ